MRAGTGSIVSVISGPSPGTRPGPQDQLHLPSDRPPRVRGFRSGAGRSLEFTWVALVLEPLVAAGAGLVAAITQTTSGRVVAPFIVEVGLALLLHTGFRLVWLLRELVRIVAADDAIAEKEQRTHTLVDLLGEE